MARSVLETLPGYRTLSYYAKWLKALEKLTIDCGMLAVEEILAARMLHPARPVPGMLRAADVPAVLAMGSTTLRESAVQARFAVGDRVRTRALPVDHHTRLPGYARGKSGRVEYIHGCHVFPDTHSQGLGEHSQWLYTVVFSGQELWGECGSRGLRVSIEAFEPYLEAAQDD
jgi:nitrile hydratase